MIRPLSGAISLWSLCMVTWGQPDATPSFEAASVRPSVMVGNGCTGGPGTASPLVWRCSGVPVSFLISYAYGFLPYQFSPRSSCCQSRYDVIARIPSGTAKDRFRRMVQRLLVDRFQLKLHLEAKEMPIFELGLRDKTVKLKRTAILERSEQEDLPWSRAEYTIDANGCPVFRAGSSGLMEGRNGCYRWTAFNVSTEEIARTLSFHLGRNVVDVSGLSERYDIDMVWHVDLDWLLERAGRPELIGEETGPTGPNLIRSVRDQLGLELRSRKGRGEVVVIDYIAKVPTEN